MRRRKLLSLAALATVLGGTLFIVLPRVSEAASGINYSPGRVVAEQGTDIEVLVHNPTDKDVVESASVVSTNANAFTNESTTPRVVEPGQTNSELLSCGASAGHCEGQLVVNVVGKGLVVSATYVRDGEASPTEIHAGDFVSFK